MQLKTGDLSPLGGFRRLFLLFLPILMMTFSSCLFLIVEKLLLARYSVQAMEAAVSSAYACQIFQAPCVALVMMAQVFVGRWSGAEEWKSIGPGLWQFIWFSILSLLFTTPLGIAYGNYFFQGTAIETIALPYYHFLILINFLFPLGATLTCFFLGQGKTRLILFSTIGFQCIKLILGYLLIFGYDPWIPSWGLMGGAISTFIAQLGFSILLLGVFLNKKHSSFYDTRAWRLKPKLFWECIHPGFLRALNRILNFASWAAIAHLMTVKGGDYILILSIGGTLFLFLPCLAEAVCQAQITIVSQILGVKDFSLLKSAFRSGSLLVFFVVFAATLPLVIFPIDTFNFLFPAIILDDASIQKTFLGVWLCFVFFAFGFVPLSSVLAFKDTKFSLFMGFVGWINGYALMFIAIKKIDIEADQFWIVLTLMHASTGLLYYLRMKWLHAKTQKPDTSDLTEKFLPQIR